MNEEGDQGVENQRAAEVIKPEEKLGVTGSSTFLVELVDRLMLAPNGHLLYRMEETNPKGIEASSPGLRGTSYPGLS